MTAGELRTRLSLEAPSRASDGGGGASITWQEVAEVWAAVRPQSAQENLALDRVAGSVSHEIVIRFRAGVTPKMRFRQGTRVFGILAAFDPDLRRHWLRCLAEERDL